MAETTCPKCWAKCEIITEDCGENMTILISRYVPLPQPDLTKLRGIIYHIEKDNHNDFGMLMNEYLWLRKLYRAVKELLEENKP